MGVLKMVYPYSHPKEISNIYYTIDCILKENVWDFVVEL